MKNFLEFKMQLAAAFAVAISEPARNEAHFVVLETKTPEFAIAHKTAIVHSDVVLFSTFNVNDRLSIELLRGEAEAMGAEVAIKEFVDIGLAGWISEIQVAGLTVSETLASATQQRIAKFSEALWAELPQKVDWATCDNGGMMMQLAVKAKLDGRKLIGAAADCARLVLHRAVVSAKPRKAVEIALAYSTGHASAEELETAIEENDKLTQDCQGSKFDAIVAATCRPECVVQSVVSCAVSDASNYGELPSNVHNAAEDAVRSFVLAACANIVRAHVELTPALEAEIGRHNHTVTPWA